MTKSEIIAELKQCKGNRKALEAAIRAVFKIYVCCNTCLYKDVSPAKQPCVNCNECGLWEVGE